MALAKGRFDDFFLGILQNCGQVEPFLDVVFSFLARRTDFFHIMYSRDDKMGFPTGVAEKMVLQIFKKYQCLVLASDPNQGKTSKPSGKRRQKSKAKKNTTSTKNPDVDTSTSSATSTSTEQVTVPTPADLPPVASTVDVATSKPEDSQKQPCEQAGPTETSQDSGQSTVDVQAPTSLETPEPPEPAEPTECFNGDILENYMWSQTGNEVDVRIPVPASVKGKDIIVEIENTHLKVALKDTHSEGPKVYIDGELQWKVHEDESVWTLVRGECVQVMLDKVEDRWWTCVIKGDREIDKSKIDTTRDISEFDEQTQHDYQKVMFDHRQKMMGKPTSEEMKTHNMLKKAWDAPNSPFAGTPFDPSKVNISGNFSE